MTGSPQSPSVPSGSAPPSPAGPGWGSPVRPKRTGAYAGVAAVVIVAAVVVGLGFANVIPGFHLGGAGGGSGGHPTQYTVTFSETGLPAGTTWSISLGGSTQSSSGTTISFAEGNGTYAFSVGSVLGYQAAPSSGTVIVSGGAVAQSVSFSPATSTTYPVTFSETGLPAATVWSVALNGSTGSATTPGSVVISEPNGTFSFTVGTVAGYTASQSSGSLTVNGAAVTRAIGFTPSRIATYAVTFSETGLPAATVWSVTLNGSTGSATTPGSISISEPNGTYPFTVESVAGFTASPASGSLTVNGAPMSEAISFATISPGSGHYAATLVAQGLPTGTGGWSATIFNSTFSLFGSVIESGTAAVFDLPNGTFYASVYAENSSYSATGYLHEFNVSGAPVDVAVVFTLVPPPPPPSGYAVTFTESGLVGGAIWTVSLDNFSGGGQQAKSGTGSTISLLEPDGTYSFFVNATGYSVSPESGEVTVRGGPTSQSVQFTLIPTYTVTFTETGLASGDTWAVTSSAGEGRAIAPNPIVLSAVANGSYSFTVNAPGYSATPASGFVNVSGVDVSQAIAFHSLGSVYRLTFSETGLPTPGFWGVYVGNVTVLFGDTSNSSDVSVPLLDGSYGWSAIAFGGYSATPSSGIATINGGPATVDLTFAPLPRGTYLVEVGSYGLSSNTSSAAAWAITLGGATQHLAGPIPAFFAVANGTYSWSVAAPTGYVALSPGGSVEIAGSVSLFGFEIGASIFFLLASESPSIAPVSQGGSAVAFGSASFPASPAFVGSMAMVAGALIIVAPGGRRIGPPSLPSDSLRFGTRSSGGISR